MLKDNFIGSVFTTPKGGSLVVRQKTSRKYVCTCSVCDNLPFVQFGTITASKKDLKSGRIPCFCSPVYKLSELTLWYVAKYRVELKGFCFIGLIRPYNGSKTKIKMMEPVTGEVSTSVTINNLDKISGFPTTRYKRTSQSNSLSLSEMKRRLDLFSKGKDIIEDNDGRYLICGICTKKGYKGKYPIMSYHLNRNRLPCPCENNKLCEFDKKVKVKNKCETFGSIFISLTERGTVEFKCKNGHLCNNTSVPAYLYSKNSCCNQCHLDSKSWNYFKERAEDDDYLYLLEITYNSTLYYKIGKAFNPRERAGKLKSQPNVCQVNIVDTVRSNHDTIFNTEVSVHIDLSKFSCNLPIQGGTEVYPHQPFILEYYNEVKSCLLG